MSRFNIAIVGGGLVGASLALALQAGAKARGWKIVLIEPFAPGDAWQPSYDARSSALSFGARPLRRDPLVCNRRGRSGAGLCRGKRLAWSGALGGAGPRRSQLA
ncbi:2-octaprenyl-6-methoxyphenyl hydroxylase, partial [Pseudomonas syringae pv. actinidiae ICMP 19096]